MNDSVTTIFTTTIIPFTNDAVTINNMTTETILSTDYFNGDDTTLETSTQLIDNSSVADTTARIIPYDTNVDYIRKYMRNGNSRRKGKAIIDFPKFDNLKFSIPNFNGTGTELGSGLQPNVSHLRNLGYDDSPLSHVMMNLTGAEGFIGGLVAALLAAPIVGLIMLLSKYLLCIFFRI